MEKKELGTNVLLFSGKHEEERRRERKIWDQITRATNLGEKGDGEEGSHAGWRNKKLGERESSLGPSDRRRRRFYREIGRN